MTLLAPGFLYAAIAAAIAVTALHFIVAREPRAMLLPTARFIPETATHALVRSRRFSDPWLLAVRVLTLLAIGAGLARPVRTPERERIARVILADVSSAPLSAAQVRDSVRALYRPGDAIVAFDSTVTRVAAPDSLASVRGGGAGSLSAALVAAHAAASSIREGADSIEMVIVSPFARNERDRATSHLRARWPGHARAVVVAGDTATAVAPQRIAWSGVARPPLASARTPTDTIGAVVAGTDVVVAPFDRRWRYTPDSLRGATVVARWSDGEPAAIERAIPRSGGCERSIAIPVDSTGDLTLRPPFVRLAARLMGPCATGGAAGTDSTAIVARLLAGAGPLARASAFPPGPAAHSPIAVWLLAFAGVLALVELLVRRGHRVEDTP